MMLRYFPGTVRLVLPKKFWDDHYDRCADHEGERIEVKRHPRTVEVDLSFEAVEDLLSDASYYAGPYGPDVGNLGPLKRSALATVHALERATK